MNGLASANAARAKRVYEYMIGKVLVLFVISIQRYEYYLQGQVLILREWAIFSTDLKQTRFAMIKKRCGMHMEPSVIYEETCKQGAGHAWYERLTRRALGPREIEECKSTST